MAVIVKHESYGLASLFAPDAVYVGPSFRQEGAEAIRAFYDGSFQAFSDTRIDTSRVIEDGDVVVAEWTSRDTHTAPVVMPDRTQIAATGNTLEVSGVTVAEVRKGRFAIVHDYYDNVPWMIALGLMPGA